MSGDNHDAITSLVYHQGSLIQKMAECIGEYLEMREDHPSYTNPIELEFDGKYKITIKECWTVKSDGK